MTAINKNNYESYYLDYLEGTLDDLSVAMLLVFLEQYPHLKLESEEFPILSSSNTSLNTSFKNKLKQIDYEMTLISVSNFESFCIAFHENQLTPAKTKEFKLFLSTNNSLFTTFELYGNLKIIPDTSIVYNHKSSLKQSRIKPLFPFISIAASALLILFGYQIWKNADTENKGTYRTVAQLNSTKNSKPIIKKTLKNSLEIVKNTDLTQFDSIPQNSIDNRDKNNVFAQNEGSKNNSTNKTNRALNIQNLNLRIPNLGDIAQSKEIITAPEHTIYPINFEQENASISAIEMKNPIKPVTKRLSEFTKTPIDYQTAKAVDKSKKGFYLKIGKFELQRPVKQL